MASLLQKLLRKPSPTRIVSSLSNLHAPIFYYPLTFDQSNVTEPPHRANLIPDSRSSSADKLIDCQFRQMFSNFSVGFSLNPNSSIGSLQSLPDDVLTRASPCIDNEIDPQNPRIYPSFSFGFFLNNNSPSGSLQSQPDDVASGGSSAIWADSVKKKRKKKMNKHKYRKLRKRLRQKS